MCHYSKRGISCLCDISKQINLIETTGILAYANYLVHPDGLAGVASQQTGYIYTQDDAGIHLFDRTGKALVNETDYRVLSIAEPSGAVSVQDRNSGKCGIWSLSSEKLTLPCAYQEIELITAQHQGSDEPPPRTVAAVTEDGTVWSVIDPVSGETLIPAGYNSITGIYGYISAE